MYTILMPLVGRLQVSRKTSEKSVPAVVLKQTKIISVMLYWYLVESVLLLQFMRLVNCIVRLLFASIFFHISCILSPTAFNGSVPHLIM